MNYPFSKKQTKKEEPKWRESNYPRRIELNLNATESCEFPARNYPTPLFVEGRKRLGVTLNRVKAFL